MFLNVVFVAGNDFGLSFGESCYFSRYLRLLSTPF
jgi:hypothetical protein